MNTTALIVRRAKRFKPADLLKEAPIKRRTLYALLSGECKNPRVQTLALLEKAVSRREAAEVKKLSIQKADKKQTQSRDKARRSVAGKGA